MSKKKFLLYLYFQTTNRGIVFGFSPGFVSISIQCDPLTMSFFGGNSAPVNQGPNPLVLAKIEAEIMTEMFNK